MKLKVNKAYIYHEAFLIPGSFPESAKARKLIRDNRNLVRVDPDRPETKQTFLIVTLLEFLSRRNLSKVAPVLCKNASR
jgi:hypothetical protein